MIVINGEEWLSTAEACAQLGPDITPAIIRDWRRRGLLEGVGIREGRATVAYHRRADLVAVEHATRSSRRGRPRQSGQRSSILVLVPTPTAVGGVCP